MRIKKLIIKDLRIIEGLEIEPLEGINVITGYNGAGKTTFLEAIFLLGNGRTFRHAEAGPMIRKGADSTLVTGRLISSSGRNTSLGVKRETRGFIARRDGKEVRRRSELVRTLPLQLLTPASHELVEKGPELRRRFLDQGLFHVEQSYHQLSLEYSAALKQRNAALKMGDLTMARSFSVWLASSGETLSLLRRKFVEEIQAELSRILPLLGLHKKVVLRLLKGWGTGDLLDALERNEKSDLKMGFTTTGCHRAELSLTVEGMPAAKILSRGEQKMLVYALSFAQLKRFFEVGTEAPVLLIDDVSSELDPNRVARLMDYLLELPCQAFLTNIGAEPFVRGGCGLFHVEHGRLAKA